MEKSGGWRWTLSTFHCELISLLEWNTKIPILPGKIDSMELWGLSFFPIGFWTLKEKGKLYQSTRFFLPTFVCISVGWILNQNFSFVSNLPCGQHTWDILLAVSPLEINVRNLGVLSETMAGKSCPELCACMGAAMQRTIYLPGAVLPAWGFMANFHGQLPGWSGYFQRDLPTYTFLDLKINLLIGKLDCSSKASSYGHVSIGTGSSLAFFYPPSLLVFP